MARRLESVSNIADFCVPAFAAEGETARIRITLFGTGATLATYAFYVVDPNGAAVEYTSSFRDVSAYLPLTFISLFDFDYTFQLPGLYSFLMHESVGGSVWAGETFVAEWATNMDIPVSDLRKQRTDIERVYNRVSRR